MANILERVLRKLNGSEASTEIAGALQALQSGREDKCAKLRQLEERRAQHLKTFEYTKARALEDDIADLRRMIASDDLHEPELIERLTTARAAEREKSTQAVVGEYLSALETYAGAVQTADLAGIKLDELWRRHEPLLRGLIEPQGCVLVLGAGHGIQWAAERRRYAKAAREHMTGRTLAAAPVAMQTQPPAPQRPRPVSQGVTLRPTPQPAAVLTAPRTPDDLGPLAPREVRVRVLSNGYCPDDAAPQCYAGQLVRMSEIRAQHATSIGKVQIVETFGEASPAVTTAAQVGTQQERAS